MYFYTNSYLTRMPVLLLLFNPPLSSPLALLFISVRKRAKQAT